MKISIVTPTFNGARFIEETILSIKAQSQGDFEHIIIDGESTDNTEEIVKRHKRSYPCQYIREKDKGMYDAINKGFARAKGEILCWVNSDDLLAPDALKSVNEIFRTHKRVAWLQGISSYIDEKGNITHEGRKWNYLRSLIRRGYYGTTLHFVHQASSFWRRDLWLKAGGISSDLKVAGDYELWLKFARFEPLYVSPVVLAYFRHHSGQLSGNHKAYLAECECIKHIGSIEKIIAKYPLKFLHPIIAFRHREIANPGLGNRVVSV